MGISSQRRQWKESHEAAVFHSHPMSMRLGIVWARITTKHRLFSPMLPSAMARRRATTTPAGPACSRSKLRHWLQEQTAINATSASEIIDTRYSAPLECQEQAIGAKAKLASRFVNQIIGPLSIPAHRIASSFINAFQQWLDPNTPPRIKESKSPLGSTTTRYRRKPLCDVFRRTDPIQ